MSSILYALLPISCALLPTAAVACDGHPRVRFDNQATLEGVLASGKGRHDAQGPFTYIYIMLDKAVCVDAAPAGHGDEDAAQNIADPVTRVQIAGETVGRHLPVGKHVTVDGTLFAAHTMWHAEDVLIDAAEIAQR
jgi:hypothetical protein